VAGACCRAPRGPTWVLGPGGPQRRRAVTPPGCAAAAPPPHTAVASRAASPGVELQDVPVVQGVHRAHLRTHVGSGWGPCWHTPSGTRQAGRAAPALACPLPHPMAPPTPAMRCWGLRRVWQSLEEGCGAQQLPPTGVGWGWRTAAQPGPRLLVETAWPAPPCIETAWPAPPGRDGLARASWSRTHAPPGKQARAPTSCSTRAFWLLSTLLTA